MSRKHHFGLPAFLSLALVAAACTITVEPLGGPDAQPELDTTSTTGASTSTEPEKLAFDDGDVPGTSDPASEDEGRNQDDETDTDEQTGTTAVTTPGFGTPTSVRNPGSTTTEVPEITLPPQPRNPQTTVPRPPTTAGSSTPTTTPTTQTPTTATPTTQTPTTAKPTTTTAKPTTTTTQPAPPTTAGRTLVFEENFNTLAASRWKSELSTYGDGNNELQCYTPQQVSVANGKLVLTAEKRTETCPNGSTREVTSGMVRSKGLTFSPGQSIEWRVKLTANDDANQAGLWPAFWASGWAGGGWPLGGEWDGFEVMTARNPKRTVFGIHYANTAGVHAKTSKELVQGSNFTDSWHSFRFDYGVGGVLVWYMDGAEVHRVETAPTRQAWPAPFNEPMTELKINLALGGNPGALDDRALPATYEIDYVRIYDMPDAP